MDIRPFLGREIDFVESDDAEKARLKIQRDAFTIVGIFERVSIGNLVVVRGPQFQLLTQ